jgi:hypothetical protein
METNNKKAYKDQASLGNRAFFSFLDLSLSQQN